MIRIDCLLILSRFGIENISVVRFSHAWRSTFGKIGSFLCPLSYNRPEGVINANTMIQINNSNACLGLNLLAELSVRVRTD